MEEHMPALSGNKSVKGNLGSRLRELGVVLPTPPTPLGAYVESSDTGKLLFLSGTLPVVDRKLAIAGRLGEGLSVKDGQEAARIAALNALAVAREHLGELDRLRKLVKLTVLIATTEQFTGHAQVADGASICLSRFLGETPATCGSSMACRVCPLAHQSSLTRFLKSSTSALQPPNKPHFSTNHL
jgi:enamine deaminase RidA (YjgF/YER057c/UK114 family)